MNLEPFLSVHWPIVRRCLASPGRMAIVDDRRQYRAGEVLAGALYVAEEVERRCETKTLGLLIPTSGAFPIAALAGWMVGKAVVPLNYLLKPEELQFVVDDCGTDTIIASRALLDHLGFQPKVKNLVVLEDLAFTGVPPARWPALSSAEDLAVLLYTSGTSGKPKGVMLTHGNVRANVEQIRRWARFDSRDTLLGVLPQFHSFGLTVLTLTPLIVGCKAVYTARFVPGKIVRLFRDHRPTMFVAIPSMYGALLSVKDGSPEDFTSLRYAVSGGEPLSEDVFTRFRDRFGVTLNEGYGLTETAPVTNWCRPEEWRRHSVGRALPWIHERIVEIATGRDLPPGEEGEVRISGPNVMAGYYNRPAENAAAFDERGYFRTGDIGKLDAEGHLYITGRLKEMLIVGGENVFPREIEEALNQHPAVRASGVVGLRDPVRGEVPVAFVEMEEGAAFSQADLLAWCRGRLAGYKVPRDIHRLDVLPRNPTGKILRRELQSLIKLDDAAKR